MRLGRVILNEVSEHLSPIEEFLYFLSELCNFHVAVTITEIYNVEKMLEIYRTLHICTLHSPFFSASILQTLFSEASLCINFGFLTV